MKQKQIKKKTTKKGKPKLGLKKLDSEPIMGTPIITEIYFGAEKMRTMFLPQSDEFPYESLENLRIDMEKNQCRRVAWNGDYYALRQSTVFDLQLTKEGSYFGSETIERECRIDSMNVKGEMRRVLFVPSKIDYQTNKRGIYEVLQKKECDLVHVGGISHGSFMELNMVGQEIKEKIVMSHSRD